MSNEPETVKAGSSPAMRTSFPQENGEIGVAPQLSPSVSDGLDGESERNMRFPIRLRYKGKGKVLVVLYRRRDGYRVYWRYGPKKARQSRAKDFVHYGAAKREADKMVVSLASGSKVADLSPGQAASAQSALEELQRFKLATGKDVSIQYGIGEYCQAARMLHEAGLNNETLAGAIQRFLGSVAGVVRKSVTVAVEAFIEAEEPRTKAAPGKRPDVSPKYHANRAIQLRRFGAMFPNTDLCDINKQHVDAFFASLSAISPDARNRRAAVSAATRNHYRGSVRQFWQFAVRNDLLRADHGLDEADSMRQQRGDGAEIQFYVPAEFAALLKAASGPMRALIAVGGLAGLRTSELLKLDWADLRRVEGHVEVTAQKSKTRQRRLVPICPALKQWLEQFKDCTGKIWIGHEITWQQNFVKVCEGAKVVRKPNGLRHSFCSYSYALHGEVETARSAGHSPAMLFRSYRGLATPADARRWFNTRPARY